MGYEKRARILAAPALCVSALALTIALTAASDTAFADPSGFGGGGGGGGGAGTYTCGSPPCLAPGGDGGHGLNSDGNGYTAGQSGANGSGAGGAGGQNAGYHGSQGMNASSNAGGGGGGGGAVAAAVGTSGGVTGTDATDTITGSHTGGYGGYGGDGAGTGSGGGGGQGGAGYAIYNGNRIDYTKGTGASILGGYGGNGGTGVYGGGGGAGGAGVQFGDTSAYLSAFANGTALGGGNTISGGKGGLGGNGTTASGASGDGGAGILFDTAGLLGNGGSIFGGAGGGDISAGLNGGAGGHGGVGVSFGGGGLLANGSTDVTTARIAGGDGGHGGVGSSGGAGGNAVSFGAGGTLGNYGAIDGGWGGNGSGASGGAGGIGVSFTGSGELTNYATGTISGGKGGTGSSSGNGGIGAVFAAGGGLENYGAISGGTGGTGGAGVSGTGLSIIQDGASASISGGGSAAAIMFTGGANSLTIKNRTSSGLTGDIALSNLATLTLDQTDNASVTIGNNITGGVTNTVTVNAGVVAGVNNVVTLNGVNTYQGLTTVGSGTLQVGDVDHTNAIITSDVTVNSGATLRGTGTISTDTSTVIVSAGATLWPGATGETSGNTLTVNGDGHVEFAGATSTFKSQGFVSGLGEQSNDLLAIGGLDPHLTGAGAAVDLAGVFLPGKIQTLITTGATGVIVSDFAQYASTDQNTLMKYLRAEVLYGDGVVGAANSVYVNPEARLHTIVGLTRNQNATATGIDDASNTGLYGNDGNLLLGNLLGGNNEASAPAALDALSGEGITGQQQTALNAGRLYGAAVMDQAVLWGPSRQDMVVGMKDGGYKDLGYQGAIRSAARLWATGFGQEASLSSQSSNGSASQSSNTSGFATGMDYQVGRNALLGIAGGYTNSNFSVGGRSTNGNVQGAHGSIYGTVNSGPAYLSAMGQYSNYTNKTSRTINYAGVPLSELAKGKFSSDEWLARLEAGYRMGGASAITPFAGFQYASLGNNAFSETSTLGGAAGVAGLHVNSQTVDSTQSFVGVQLDTKTMMGSWTVMPYARISWEHEFNTGRNQTAYLLSLPEASFKVAGASVAADAARVQTGIKADVTSSIGVFANFDGDFSGRGDNYAGTGGITIRW
jgi:uncharacterized protein with beta-barrel porin domain